jgi:carbonic anhydrase
MRANVRASVAHLRHGSAIIETLALQDGLVVIGAELNLTSGEVTFFDEVPE